MNTPNILRHHAEASPHYQRRMELDPLEVVAMDRLARQSLYDQDMEAIHDSTDPSERLELLTDAVYLSIGLRPAKEVNQLAKTGYMLAKDLSTPLVDKDSCLQRARMGDLQLAAAFANYHDLLDLTTNRKEARTAYASLDASLVGAIRSGANLLVEMQHLHEDSIDKLDLRDQQELRGAMFEVLTTTYQRYQTYSTERSDTELTLMGTQFSDCPSVHFLPNHNFDILTLGPTGEALQMIQAKNYDSDQSYDRRITVVKAKRFSQFMANSTDCVRAINELALNGELPDGRIVSEQQMRNNVELMDSLFSKSHAMAA